MTTMTDPMILTLQDNALLLMAQHAAFPPPTHRPAGTTKRWEAELDGMAKVACDALHIGQAPFGVALAVMETVKAMPHPLRTTAFYLTHRSLWRDAVVNEIRRQLDQPRNAR